MSHSEMLWICLWAYALPRLISRPDSIGFSFSTEFMDSDKNVYFNKAWYTQWLSAFDHPLFYSYEFVGIQIGFTNYCQLHVCMQ